MATPIQPLYTATATANGGRAGRTKSESGLIDMPLALPKALGGQGGQATNPEELFAAGYAACFEGALRLVAGKQGKRVPPEATITAAVTIGKTDDGGLGLAVKLTGNLPGLSREEAQALMEAAHQVCPYSKATRGNVDVQLAVAG